MPSTNHSISANIRAEMARRGLNQTDVASVLGLSQVSISARLRNATPWRVTELTALAAHFGLPVASLLEDSLGGAA